MDSGHEICIEVTLAAGNPVKLKVNPDCKVWQVTLSAEQIFSRHISRLVTEKGEILPTGSMLSSEGVCEGDVLTAIAGSNLRRFSSIPWSLMHILDLST